MLGRRDGLAQVLGGALAREVLRDAVECGGAPVQHGQRGGERVQVGVAPLEAAAAALLERRPGVQQPDVVEDQAVARPEPELHPERRAQRDRGEPPVRGVEGVQFVGGQSQGTDRAVVEPHFADPPERVQFDQRAVGAQFGGPVAEHERDGRAGEHREVPGRLLPQGRGGPEAVDQGGVAADGRVLQTVQQLEGRYRVAVRIVGVRGDGGAGERQVGGIRLDPDVEQLSVVGLPDVPEGPRHLEYLPLHPGHPAQQREAGAPYRAEHRRPLRRVGQVGGPVGLGEAGGEVGGRPEPFAGLAASVVGGLLVQPAERVPRAVAVGPAHLEQAVGLLLPGYREILGQVGDLEQLLPVARVAALVAGAVVAQPVRREAHGSLLLGTSPEREVVQPTPSFP